MVSFGLMAAPPTMGSAAIGAMAAPSAGAMAVESAGVVVSLLLQAPSAISAPPDTATSMSVRILVMEFRSLLARFVAVTTRLRSA